MYFSCQGTCPPDPLASLKEFPIVGKDGWVDERVIDWLLGWIDGSKEGRKYTWVYGHLDGRMDDPVCTVITLLAQLTQLLT